MKPCWVLVRHSSRLFRKVFFFTWLHQLRHIPFDRQSQTWRVSYVKEFFLFFFWAFVSTSILPPNHFSSFLGSNSISRKMSLQLVSSWIASGCSSACPSARAPPLVPLVPQQSVLLVLLPPPLNWSWNWNSVVLNIFVVISKHSCRINWTKFSHNLYDYSWEKTFKIWHDGLFNRQKITLLLNHSF